MNGTRIGGILAGIAALVVVIATRTQDSTKMSLPIYIIVVLIAGGLASDFIVKVLGGLTERGPRIYTDSEKESISLAKNLATLLLIGTVCIWATPPLMTLDWRYNWPHQGPGNDYLIGAAALLIVIILVYFVPVTAAVATWQAVRAIQHMADPYKRSGHGVVKALLAVGMGALSEYLYLHVLGHTISTLERTYGR